MSYKSVGISTILSIQGEEFLDISREYPPDFESFRLLRDEVFNHLNLDAVNKSCHFCGMSKHLSLSCPLIFYQPDILRVTNSLKKQ